MLRSDVIKVFTTSWLVVKQSRIPHTQFMMGQSRRGGNHKNTTFAISAFVLQSFAFGKKNTWNVDLHFVVMSVLFTWECHELSSHGVVYLRTMPIVQPVECYKGLLRFNNDIYFAAELRPLRCLDGPYWFP
uniref:Uncharacterized protein n=1 Tax=Rhipicephalus zambeziensis TaxID=60191 RepID=A0A224YGE3_9ACAR